MFYMTDSFFESGENSFVFTVCEREYSPGDNVAAPSIVTYFRICRTDILVWIKRALITTKTTGLLESSG